MEYVYDGDIHMKKIIKNNVSWVGYIDWELQKFHGDDYTIMNGSSQNAYLIEEIGRAHV